MAKVYVSSTRLDLAPERKAIIDWLVQARHQPVHSYVADTDSVRESCLNDVRTCDNVRRSLDIRVALDARDRRNVRRRIDVAPLNSRLGTHAGVEPAARREHLSRGREILLAFKEAGRRPPNRNHVAWFAERLAALGQAPPEDPTKP